MRVVFDTNIFVSAFVIPSSQAERAILRIIEKDDSLFFSKAILDELNSVLARKFSRDAEEISRIAVFLRDIAEWVSPDEPISILKDEPDNRILECAVSAEANVIVTGDKELLALKQYRGVRVISLKEYLENDR